MNYTELSEPRKRQTRVYVAGAYSADNVIDILNNMRVGMRASKDVLLAGFAPFSPWLDYQFSLMLEGDEALTIDNYYRYSIAWLEASDCMVIISGYGKSRGVLLEMQYAQDHGIPIYESVGELCDKEERWRSIEPRDAMHTIANIVPGRTLNAIADGLRVGLRKHDTWDNNKGIFHYDAHRSEHFGKLMAGEMYDRDDGHHNGAACIIRDMQILDYFLDMEGRVNGTTWSNGMDAGGVGAVLSMPRGTHHQTDALPQDQRNKSGSQL